MRKISTPEARKFEGNTLSAFLQCRCNVSFSMRKYLGKFSIPIPSSLSRYSFFVEILQTILIKLRTPNLWTLLISHSYWKTNFVDFLQNSFKRYLLSIFKSRPSLFPNISPTIYSNPLQTEIPRDYLQGHCQRSIIIHFARNLEVRFIFEFSVKILRSKFYDFFVKIFESNICNLLQ